MTGNDDMDIGEKRLTKFCYIGDVLDAEGWCDSAVMGGLDAQE